MPFPPLEVELNGTGRRATFVRTSADWQTFFSTSADAYIVFIYSETCPVCHERAPEFADLAKNSRIVVAFLDKKSLKQIWPAGQAIQYPTVYVFKNARLEPVFKNAMLSDLIPAPTLLARLQRIMTMATTTTNEPKLTICTEDYRPVCGADGKTYSNKCHLNAAKVPMAYDGKCTARTPDVLFFYNPNGAHRKEVKSAFINIDLLKSRGIKIDAKPDPNLVYYPQIVYASTRQFGPEANATLERLVSETV